MRRSRSVLLVVALAILYVPPAVLGQARTGKTAPGRTTPAKPAPFRPVVLSVGGGFGLPLSRDGIKQFWMGGPTGSLGVLFRMNRSFAAGLGVEGAFLPFDEMAFGTTYPAVSVHHMDVGLVHLFVQAKYTPFGKYRLAPYLAGTLGGARLSNAEYYEVIGGKRVTYYSIRAITRFAAGMGLGTDLMLSRSLYLWAELKGTYIHNDPNIGLWTSLVGGLRFVL